MKISKTEKLSLLTLCFLASLAAAPSARADINWWIGPGAGAGNNWSIGANWTNATLGTVGTAPASGNDVKFYDLGGSVGAAVSNIDDTVDTSFTIGSLQFATTNNSHTMLITNGVTLSVTNTGGLSVGNTANVNTAVVTATITGAGTLNLNNPASVLLIDQGLTANGNGTQRATLDLTGLGTFVANIEAIAVGTVSFGGANNVQNATGTLKLAQTNYITNTFIGTAITNGATSTPTNAIQIGADNGNAGGVDFLYLGESNAFYIDSIGVGTLKTTASMLFNPAFANNNPVAYFRGAGGDTSRIRFWSISDMSSSGSSSGNSSGTNDFTGGSADILVDTMSLARDRQGGNTSAANITRGTFILPAGRVNVNTLLIGNQQFTATANLNPMNGFFNLSGAAATLQVNSNLTLGNTAVNSQAATNTFGVLSITGGSAYVNNITVGPFTLSAKNAINLTNATLIVSNTLATNASGLAALTVGNSTLGLTVTGNSLVGLVKTLTTFGATNLVQLASVPVFSSYPQTIPLIQYGTLSGSFNFGLANAVASAPGAYLTNLTTVPPSIALVLPNDPRPVITSGPASYSGNPGDNVPTNFTVSISAASVTPLTTHWYYTNNAGGPLVQLTDGSGPSGVSLIAGSTTTNLQMTDAQSGDNGDYFVVVSNADGVTTSGVAVLTISSGSKPTITGPANQTTVQGNNATFSATVSANPAAVLQWQESGTNIPGATGTSVVLNTVQFPADDQVVISIIASNSFGMVTNFATNYVLVPPGISSQPVSLAVLNGQAAALSVTATGQPAPQYQWYMNNSPLSLASNPTATNATLTIASVAPTNTGSYYVQISNTTGPSYATNSLTVTLTVNSAMTAAPTSPLNGAVGVCYDTPLYLSFNQTPVLRKAGKIRIYNSTNSLTPVDTVDLSLNVDNSGTSNTNNAFNVQAHSPFSGDAQAFNYFPVIITGTTAAIYPHLDKMTSNQNYYVTVDDGTFADASGAYFGGLTNSSLWSFTTKPSGPANPTNLVVSADGTGDFLTVQGAVDSVPASNTVPTLINVRDGVYTEIVDISVKNNLIFRGQSRAGTMIGYPNNANVAPSGTTHARMAFKVNANDISLDNLTITNMTPVGGSQAEALMIETGARRCIVNNCNIGSYQDTVLANVNSSQGYFNNSLIEGQFDYVWGGGNLFFTNCELRTLPGFNGALNTGNLSASRTDNGATGNWAGNSGLLVSNGISFVDCMLTRLNTNIVNTTLADANGSPNGLAAWINCSIDSNYVTPTAAVTNSQILWEYGNSNLTDTAPVSYGLVDLSSSDARLLAAQNSTSWLNGWVPQLSINLLAQPSDLNLNGGATIGLSVSATGIPAPSYQWWFNGAAISGANGSVLTLSNANVSLAGSYSVVISNASGSVTSRTALVTVANTAPTLPVILDQTVNVGAVVVVPDVATDPDVPTQSLAYSLAGGLGTINPAGVFIWRPLIAQAGTTNAVSVVVTDSGTPPLSATNNFNIIVNPVPQPVFSAPMLTVGQFSVTITGQTGPDYAIQVASDLTSGIWTTIFRTNSPVLPFTFTDPNPGTAPMQFYRIVVGPPLP